MNSGAIAKTPPEDLLSRHATAVGLVADLITIVSSVALAARQEWFGWIAVSLLLLCTGAVCALCTVVLARKRPAATLPSRSLPYYPSRVRKIAACTLGAVGTCGVSGAYLLYSQPHSDLKLVTEPSSIGAEDLTVRFTLNNNSPRKSLTITDVRLVVLLAAPHSGSSYFPEHADLGAFPITGGLLVHPIGLAAPAVSLWDPESVLRLTPGASQSLRFELYRPINSPDSLFLIFALAAQFYDQDGHHDMVWSDFLYCVSSDDVQGFRVEKRVPFKKADLSDLRARYGPRLRDPYAEAVFGPP